MAKEASNTSTQTGKERAAAQAQHGGNNLAQRAARIAKKYEDRMRKVDSQLNHNRDESLSIKKIKDENESSQEDKADRIHKMGKEKQISKQQTRSANLKSSKRLCAAAAQRVSNGKE